MATHSSVLAWKIPGTGEPGRLPSMGSHRVGHDWSDLAAAAHSVWNNVKWVKPLCITILRVLIELKVELPYNPGFPGGKNPPANAGDITDVGSIPGSEDPLEKGMATHPSILAWRIPWPRNPGGLRSMGWQRVRHDWSNLARTPRPGGGETVEAERQKGTESKYLQTLWRGFCVISGHRSRSLMRLSDLRGQGDCWHLDYMSGSKKLHS